MYITKTTLTKGWFSLLTTVVGFTGAVFLVKNIETLNKSVRPISIPMAKPKTAVKVVGVAAAVVGVTYLASQATDDDSADTGYDPLLGGGDGGTDMKFDYVNSSWLDTASEDELRATSSEMESLLDELDYDSDEYTRISNIHIDVVNTIASRFPLNLLHREHGWYLPNDD